MSQTIEGDPIEGVREWNSQILEKIRAMRDNRPVSSDEAYDDAQIAIGVIVQALAGVVSEEAILSALEHAKDPNAVSRALRSLSLKQ